MKKIIIYVLVLVYACENNKTITPKTNDFFSNNIQSSLKSDNLNDFRIKVINYLKSKDSLNGFSQEFLDKYGRPHWDALHYISGENQKVWLVPIVEKQSVSSLWLFTLTDNKLVYNLLFRDDCRLNDHKMVNIMLDYSEFLLFDKQPQSYKFVKNSLKEFVKTEKCYLEHIAYVEGVGNHAIFECVTTYVWVEQQDFLWGGPGGGNPFDDISSDRKIIGGGTPSSPDVGEPEDEDELVPEIETVQLDPCAKQIVSAVMHSNNSVVNLIKKIFSTNKNVNLKFISEKLNSGDVAYVTAGSGINGPDKNNLFGNIIIKMNTDYTKTATTEYNASTIIHECIHVLIMALQKADPNKCKEMFGWYIDNLNNTSLTDSYKQHYEMAKNHVQEMASFIKKLNPTFSEKRCEALAWGGLENTALFKNKSTEFKNYVKQVNKAESTGINSKGTKCIKVIE